MARIPRTSSTNSRRRKPDSELQIIRRLMTVLGDLPQTQRARVLSYVAERIALAEAEAAAAAPPLLAPPLAEVLAAPPAPGPAQVAA